MHKMQDVQQQQNKTFYSSAVPSTLYVLDDVLYIYINIIYIQSSRFTFPINRTHEDRHALHRPRFTIVAVYGGHVQDP